jgi:hypothetical protein
MPPQLPDRELIKSPVHISTHAGIVRLINDFTLDIKAGRITGYSIVHQFGAGTLPASQVTVWDGAITYPWPTTAETVRIKAGGDVADTAAGAGARSVLVQGLDENFDEASELLVTNGALASTASTTLFSRIFKISVIDVGTYGVANTDDIVLENTTALTELAIIKALNGNSLMSLYTVPNNRRMYLEFVDVNVDANKSANMRMCARNNADNWTAAPFDAASVVESYGGIIGPREISVHYEISFEAKTDVWIEAIPESATSLVESSIHGVLVDTTLL